MSDQMETNTTAAPEPAKSKSFFALAKEQWRGFNAVQKIATVAVPFVVLGVMGSCGESAEKKDAQPAASTTETTETVTPETVTETVTPTETAAAPAPRSLDDLYVEKVREVAGVSGDDTTLIALGHGICALFEEGNGLLETGLNLMSENDLTMNQSGSLMGLASAAYCPNFEYLFKE